MNQGQLAIKMGAHVGAQKAATNMADSYNYNASDAVKRKIIKRDLAEAGFGAFLVDTDPHGGNTPKPIAIGTQSDESESWTYWAVFDRAEVEAYLKYTDRENEDCLIVKSGEKCPEDDCEGYVSYRHDYDCTRCDSCRSMYDHRENNTLLSKCEAMFGGRSYSGPGQRFTEDPHARISGRGTRILVKQYGGWDV